MEVIIVIKYPRKLHGGELWAKIEVIENVFTPLFKGSIINIK